MHNVSHGRAAGRAAQALYDQHGKGSAFEAAHRAEEHFANIDVGGFAFWKSVEKVLERAFAIS